MGFESQFDDTLQFNSQRETLLQFNSEPFSTTIDEVSTFDRVMSFTSEWITEEL